mgnify:CR=1 FL=1
MWQAFIDESESDRRRDPDVYILSAALVDQADLADARAEIRRLLRPGQRKLHWRAESDRTREVIAKTIASLPALHVIVVRVGRPGERSERRRRKCLERLAYELDHRGVLHLTAEAREPKQNAADLHHFRNLRAAQRIQPRMRLYHVPGPGEPLLWLADAVAGAVTAARTGAPRYLQMLDGLIELVSVEVP